MMPRKQKKKLPIIEIFDAAAGQDYRLPSHARENAWFSSLENDCVVIRMSWMSTWSVLLLKGKFVKRLPLEALKTRVVYDICAKTGSSCFFAVCPARSLGNIGALQNSQLEYYGDSLFTQFVLNESTIDSFLREATSKGNYEEWIIGAAIDSFHPRDLKDLNARTQSLQSSDFFISFHAIGSLWVFDFETGEILAVFRRFNGYEKSVSAIVETFAPKMLPSR